MRNAERTEYDHDQHRRDRNEKGETASVTRTQQIQNTDHEDRKRSEFFGMGHTEIREGRKRADCGRHQIIGDEQKCADN
jgi:hypothetical protein